MTTLKNPARTLCRNCVRKPWNRPLGLCYSCYYTPGVRERFGGLPSGTRAARMRAIATAGTRCESVTPEMF